MRPAGEGGHIGPVGTTGSVTTGSVATGGAVDSVADDVAGGLVATDAVEAGGGAGRKGMDEPALEFLENYDWPGNLRELENEVTRMLIFAQGTVVGAEVISRHILQAAPSEMGADRSADGALMATGSLKDRVELVEMRILRETLTRLRWNKSHAAAELGLSRVGLRAKLDRYGIDRPGRVSADEEEED